MKENKNTHFPGFPKQIEYSHWQFPTIINGYVHIVSSGEFKVLWYILRHTFGWQKTTDKLARSQISKGITKRNGEILDSGTGLSVRQVERHLKTLEEKKFIRILRTQGKVNEITLNITTRYKSVAGTGDIDVATPGTKMSPTINKPINTSNKRFSSKKKPYFWGREMRKKEDKWHIIPPEGGPWIPFTGKESEIEWKSLDEIESNKQSRHNQITN